MIPFSLLPSITFRISSEDDDVTTLMAILDVLDLTYLITLFLITEIFKRSVNSSESAWTIYHINVNVDINKY